MRRVGARRPSWMSVVDVRPDPRRRVADAMCATPALPIPPASGPRSYMSANGKTVLLVEDNEDNRIVYSTILRHFGYSVTEALNGEEGIAKAKSEKPDLILMDISIPIIDGWEATQVLKHDPETSMIPIIALTAHALASDREKAMEVGCDGYLAKPCEPRAVVAEVQRFLGKGNPPAATAASGAAGGA
ncbi:MAG: response regulator [Gemmatirosa sp.]|nr:response regulator [Gemmatirosa sp.]